MVVAATAQAWPSTSWRSPCVGVAGGGVVRASLGGDFVYDDPNAVDAEHADPRLTPISRFLKLSTRPLTDYSFAIDYAIGGLEPASYHATGIVLHAAHRGAGLRLARG